MKIRETRDKVKRKVLCNDTKYYLRRDPEGLSQTGTRPLQALSSINWITQLPHVSLTYIVYLLQNVFYIFQFGMHSERWLTP